MPRFFVANPIGTSIQSSEIDADAVTTAKIKEGSANTVLRTNSGGTAPEWSTLANANIGSSAAIAYSKLAALTSSNILVGNVSNVATSVSMSGDATIDNTGALTVADNAINLAKMAHGTDGNLITYDAAGAPANVATGSSGQVLTSNGVGTAPTFQAAAGGTEIKAAVATWTTTFTTTSGTYVDITNGTVTLSGLTAGTTYTLIAMANVVSVRMSTSGVGRIKLLVDGSMGSEAQDRPADATPDARNNPSSLIGMKTGVTGATSYIAKLQANSGDGGTHTINANAGDTAAIILLAIEE